MTPSKLTKNAQVVQNALDSKGISCTVIELSDSTRTAQQAADAVGCNVAQITKSLIFKTVHSHKPILILASGSNRVNEKIIELYVGEKIMRADPEFARDITGFAIGGIPPIGHKKQIDFIFIDRDLLKFETLWAAAGTPNAIFNLHSKDIVTLTNGTVIAIT